ncbi:MAG: HD domain-containing phosphohydrolase [Candidatus Krumholzibacteria bacterium]|nr:HD domain-containing phosphohydrolase [Candidatus Krumholzibacteria bacterium]
MATRFESIELNSPDLFGVRLNGAVGRSDKQNLLELVEKCLANGKVKLVLDLSELSSIGGGGAKILANFQKDLQAQGGEAVVAGAGETVRQFLVPKFEGLPLRFFHSVKDADNYFHAENYDFEALATATADAAHDEEVACEVEAAAEVADAAESDSEIGAIGFMDDSEEFVPDGDDLLGDEPQAAATTEPAEAVEPAPEAAADEGSEAMNDVLEEFNGPSEDEDEDEGGENAPGSVSGSRRKRHKYTSLPEAVAALGNWSEYEGHEEFAKALGNLLFSHGLADDSLLLTVQDGVLLDANNEWALDVDGDFASQVVDIGAPMTMLDVHMQDLSDRESSLLEETTPDIILPIMRDESLSAILFLNRDDQDNEYSVAEHFALELLMRVLVENQSRADDASEEARRTADMSGGLNPSSPSVAENNLTPSPVVNSEDSLAETLLELALNLPEAEDRPHFWRLFARHVGKVLPLSNLAYLAPRMHRAQIISGDSDQWRGTNLGEKKLQHFFRSMERPVEVAYLPTFFKEIKLALTQTGSEWIVGLKWDQEFLGTVFISMEKNFQAEEPREVLENVFAETARLLSRFDDTHDNADVNMNLVRMLIAQREQRCHGSDQLTQAMCDELHRLANVMGFPPEQERNLIYGCLLRDVGLITQEDALMGSPEHMDPTQWPVYRQHPTEGVKLLAGLSLPQTIIDVVRCHHERFNGEGFPLGLQGRKIPLAARVVTVVENYVAMIQGTGGRKPMTRETVEQVLRDNLGDRYDPDIVSLFLKSKEADLEDPADEVVGRQRRTLARV